MALALNFLPRQHQNGLSTVLGFLFLFLYFGVQNWVTPKFMLTPKFMPHSHHWNFYEIFRNFRKYSFYLTRENLSFVYISFKYFLLSFYNTDPSFFLHSKTVQSFSHARLFATPWTAAHQASLSITNSKSLLRLMSIKLVMPSKHLILCHLLLLLPSIFPSIRVMLRIK